MNRQQRIAYATPCFEAEQCIDRRYYGRGGGGFIVGLTANIGLE